MAGNIANQHNLWKTNFFITGCERLLRQPAMWPWKRKESRLQSAPSQQFSYSQLDITETFGDNSSLKAEDWIKTIPLNSTIADVQSMGLPPVGASDDEVYRIAEYLSRMRESVHIPNDGVYCPICHIANVTLARLRTPCPKCSRELLKFGWD